ncbi:hypothetical protein C8R47DRAFT_1238853 [Mycena vitilis]|nr:hypothetical protein C8R47DRAFT_1238853 [Mycena vitilis]
MASDVSQRVLVHAYFRDYHHPFGPAPNFIREDDATAFRGKQVWEVLFEIQEQHRSECVQERCDSCQAFGAILVKSAWLLDKTPDAATFNAISSNNGNQYMVSGFSISQYLQPHEGQSPAVVILVLECAFDAKNRLPAFGPHKSSVLGQKRPHPAGDPDSDVMRKRPNVDLPSPNGICVIRSSQDPTAPVNLPSSDIPFARWKDQPGGVLRLDKSEYISKMDALLNKPETSGCVVTLPPGVGKSGFLGMFSAWVDIAATRNANEKLWEDTAILAAVAKERQARIKLRIKRDDYWSGGECLCLVFDLAKIKILGVGPVQYPISTYLVEVIKAFLAKYESEFGMDSFNATTRDWTDPVSLIKKILRHAASRNLELFIAIDHWDAPILSSLAYDEDARTRYIARYITDFVTASSDPERSQKVAKLLILGNIPLFELNKSAGRHCVIEDISWDKSLEGAFGMDENELQNFASVLCHNRHVKMPDTNTENWNALKQWTFGPIVKPYPPARISAAPAPAPPLMLNISLVLNFLATKLGLSGSHTTLADSPWLPGISERCDTLLQYSSLRRTRWLRIQNTDTIREFALETLLAHVNEGKYLHALLVYLGAVQVLVVKGVIYLGMSSPFAVKQLFCKLPAIPDQESIRDIQLIALLEGDPYRVSAAVESLLRMKPWLDLYKMGEDVFQAMWEVFIAADHQLVKTSRESDGSLAYTNNIFPQLGLLTDSKIKKVDTYTHWSGNILTAGLNRFGYLDIFLCAFRKLHPGVALAIELKYLNLHGIFRAECKSEKECHSMVYGSSELPSTFMKKCEEKQKKLDKMSLKELREVNYHFWSYPKAGGKAVSHTVKFGLILDAGENQLKKYLNAIVNGEAFKTYDGSGQEGLTAADGRVKVSRDPTDSPDKVIGYLIVGIGSRIIASAVKPDKQNTRYQYTSHK